MWYRKAADQGGQYNVGAQYEAGIGMRQDYGQAMSWYHKAADLGLDHAEQSLVRCMKMDEGFDRT